MDLVIFDVDGTLTATTGVDDQSMVAAVRAVMGFTIADTDWGNYLHSTDQGLTIETSERQLGRRPTGDEIAAIKARFFQELRERIGRDPGSCRAVEGAREMLARVRESGEWRVGIASGAWAESAAIKLGAARVEVAGLPATFSHAAEDGRPLFREEIIAKTMAALAGSGRPSRVVYVGDGVWDARAARKLNIGFVGVRHDGREERLRNEGVARIVRGYADLEGFVGLLRGA